MCMRWRASTGYCWHTSGPKRLIWWTPLISTTGYSTPPWAATTARCTRGKIFIIYLLFILLQLSRSCAVSVKSNYIACQSVNLCLLCILRTFPVTCDHGGRILWRRCINFLLSYSYTSTWYLLLGVCTTTKLSRGSLIRVSSLAAALWPANSCSVISDKLCQT